MVELLNSRNIDTRLEALRKIAVKANKNEFKDVNNHIHTTFSFSPYSPTKAVYMAYTSGLCTAGIMDHDSICGAKEFKDAARILNIPSTCGVECRVSFKNTKFADKKINNPDQNGVAYIALHGVPSQSYKEVEEYFKPVIEKRNVRNKKMLCNINEIFAGYGIRLDFEKDVLPVSYFEFGGTVTERHLLYALSLKIIEKFQKGDKLISFLENDLKIALTDKVRGYFSDINNVHYEYDLLSLLKAELVDRFYVAATDECPDVTDVLKLAKDVGAISAYAYLGDVGDSVTGDKKTQKFEDDYLDELFEAICEMGFNAVTYMPSRNSEAQLDRVRALCEKYKLFQISGEDINSSRQEFICKAQRNEKYSNLYDATWALIGHEIAASEDIKNSMFSDETIKNLPDLKDRIEYYKNVGIKKS